MRHYGPPRTSGAAHRPGFTVVELVAALSLTAGALSLTYATFRLAIRAQERGTVRIEMLQRIDSALDMMARDLRGAINLGDEADYIFESTDDTEGDMSADTLGFVATVNNPRMSASVSYDLARIEYYLDFDPDTPEQGLVRRQLNFPLPEDEEDREAIAHTIEVLPMAESLSILLHDAASAEWVENWDEMQGMPTAVKIELITTMAQEPTEDEEEEEDEAAEAPESKVLTLLVHIPASRYTPSVDDGGGGQGEAVEEGEEERDEEPGPQGGPGGGGGQGGPGGPGGPEIPEFPGFPTGGFPTGGEGGGGR